MSGSDRVNSGHILGFDYLRVAAVFAVIWIHGSDTNQYALQLQVFGAFAVPSFILMSAYLSVENFAAKRAMNLAQFLYSRAGRLMPAYICWSLIYIVFRFYKHRFISGTPFHVDWVSVIFFGGASYQLWFVPAIFIWSVVFAPLMLLTARKGWPVAAGAAMVFSGAALYLIGLNVSRIVKIPEGYEMVKYLMGDTGYIFIGMGLWLLSGSVRRSAKYSESSGGSLVGLAFMGVLLVDLRLGILRNWFTPLLSLSAFWMSLRRGDPANSLIAKHLSSCAFGIYLSHGIFVEGFQTAAGVAGINAGSFFATAGIILSAFICSASLCILLRTQKATRWLVI